MSALDYIGLCTGNSAFVAQWDAACRDDHNKEQKWIADLRANDVKAAHPDDAWVDRKDNSFQLVYPQFNDGVMVGDRVALGWHFDRTRIVRVIRIEHSKSYKEIVRYFFEPDRYDKWPT